jgi:hypothetical protein
MQAGLTLRSLSEGRLMNKRLVLSFAIVIGFAAATAQAVSLTGGTYSENFDSMTATGVAAPAGWTVDSTAGNTGTGTATTAPVNTGAVSVTSTVVVNTGSTLGQGNYNFGIAGTNPITDRALGSIASSSSQRDTYVSFTNNVGVSLTQFTIKYDGEQWRLGAAAPAINVLTLQYSATGLSGSWVALGSGFNFTSPINTGSAGVALDGNAAANRVANIGGVYTPASAIANGSSFFLRWADPDDGAADDGMAIDNFSITVVPEPGTVATGLLTLCGLGWYQRRRFVALLRSAAR